MFVNLLFLLTMFLFLDHDSVHNDHYSHPFTSPEPVGVVANGMGILFLPFGSILHCYSALLRATWRFAARNIVLLRNDARNSASCCAQHCPCLREDCGCLRALILHIQSAGMRAVVRNAARLMTHVVIPGSIRAIFRVSLCSKRNCCPFDTTTIALV